MKILYFVGNEGLWKAAWFQKYLEAFRANQNLQIILMDYPADLAKIKELPLKVNHNAKAILQEGLNFEELFDVEEKYAPQEFMSCVLAFAEKPNSARILKEVSIANSVEEFLNEINLNESTKIYIEDLLTDLDLSAPVTNFRDKEVSQINSEILLADADEISKLIIRPDFKETSTPDAVTDIKTDIKTEIKTEIKIGSGTDIEKTRALDVSADVNAKGTQAESPPSIISISIASSPSATSPSATVGSRPHFNEASGSIPDIIHDLENMEKAKAEEQVASVDIRTTAIDETRRNFSVEAPDEKSALEVKSLISSMSNITNEDVEVIKRFSVIKERELREAQASQDALRQQMKLHDEKLKRNEDERRRLQLRLEEVENELRASNDRREENKAQLRNVESHYDEKIKELQVQLESAQFQASKLDRKLEEFRERVRTDLQKIRSRERELSSRLEIQKRDAEALLSAKDERLLSQKREIDRLEFELDALREKLLDEAQRSEERRKRVARALQSLKLAQSVLSGLEEEGIVFKDDTKAA